MSRKHCHYVMIHLYLNTQESIKDSRCLPTTRRHERMCGSRAQHSDAESMARHHDRGCLVSLVYMMFPMHLKPKPCPMQNASTRKCKPHPLRFVHFLGQQVFALTFRTLMFFPPVSFGLVEEGLYRSALPNEINYPFLERLGLKTIIFLYPDEEIDAQL